MNLKPKTKQEIIKSFSEQHRISSTYMDEFLKILDEKRNDKSNLYFCLWSIPLGIFFLITIGIMLDAGIAKQMWVPFKSLPDHMFMLKRIVNLFVMVVETSIPLAGLMLVINEMYKKWN